MSEPPDDMGTVAVAYGCPTPQDTEENFTPDEIMDLLAIVWGELKGTMHPVHQKGVEVYLDAVRAKLVAGVQK
jgi:hypothetical protein